MPAIMPISTTFGTRVALAGVLLTLSAFISLHCIWSDNGMGIAYTWGQLGRNKPLV